MTCYCSNSSVGVFIGVLDVLAYIGLAIISLCYVVDIDNRVNKEEHELAQYRSTFIALFVLCLIMTIISGILIMGIVKRRHKLIAPWLILEAISYVLTCCRFSYKFFEAIFGGAPFSVILMTFVLGLAIIALWTLIIRFVCHIYRDVRNENIEKRDQVMRGAEMEYKTQERFLNS